MFSCLKVKREGKFFEIHLSDFDRKSQIALHTAINQSSLKSTLMEKFSIFHSSLCCSTSLFPTSWVIDRLDFVISLMKLFFPIAKIIHFSLLFTWKHFWRTCNLSTVSQRARSYEWVAVSVMTEVSVFDLTPWIRTATPHSSVYTAPPCDVDRARLFTFFSSLQILCLPILFFFAMLFFFGVFRLTRCSCWEMFNFFQSLVHCFYEVSKPAKLLSMRLSSLVKKSDGRIEIERFFTSDIGRRRKEKMFCC